ncbi:MAG: type II toxin-antitoxin system RelE/ParE family toxin [Cellulosilyticaceae bacterium]
MHKIRLTPKALEDLRAIKRYVAEELENEKAANKLIKQIIDGYEQLKEFPLMGPSLSAKIDMRTDYRFLVCGKYTVFYKCDASYVSIYRVLYNRRDYMRALFEEEILH